MSDDIFRASGEIRLTWDGVDMVLRRPTFGEHRKLRDGVADDQMEELVDAQRLAATLQRLNMNREQRRNNPVEVPGGELDQAEFYARQTEREERRVRWWVDTVIPTLCAGTAPALTVDDVPSWLGDPTLVTEAMQHWRQRPQGPGAA